MPEVASIPILSSVAPSVSTTAAAGAAAASAGVAGTGQAGSAAYAGNDSGMPAGPGNASFANILKRQIEQPANATTATANGTADGALQGGLTLIADLFATQPLEPTAAAIAQLAGLANSPQATPIDTGLSEATQAADSRNASVASLLADAKAERRGGADTDRSDKALAALATLEHQVGKQTDKLLPVVPPEDPAPAFGALDAKLAGTLAPVAETFEKTAGSSKNEDQDNDNAAQPQPPADSSLAALLAFFPPPAPAIRNQTDVAVKEGHAMPQEESLALPQLGQGKDGVGASGRSATQANLADALQGAPGKTAEIAAQQALATEAAATNKDKGGANAEVSFDNLLAAAHAQIANHGHDRNIRTPANAENPIKMETPVGSNGWDHEVGEKLVWMVGRQEQRAELVLNPPQLGRVEISLSITGDQTNASFVAANPAVREALESALPRLREMFADAGLSLGQAQVGADSGNNAANQSAANGGNRDNSSPFSSALNGQLDDTMSRLTGSGQWLRQGRGMVDVFA